MEIQVAVAKIGKYATSESGDTVEMIERPLGGLSLVMADGQRSGKPAKVISNVVVRKAISLLGEGVRDGAAARATQDYLYTYRRGKVQATLNIASVDLQTRTVVLSRNNQCPVIVVNRGSLGVLDDSSVPIGVHRGTKPVITEIPITAGTYVVMFTDGIADAGVTSPDGPLDVPKLVSEHLDIDQTGHDQLDDADVTDEHLTTPLRPDARGLADAILYRAISRDDGRPRDDMTVVVLASLDRTMDDDVRHMFVRYPIPHIVN